MNLYGEIEIKREELIKCMKKNKKINRDVIKKSKELDQYINDYYKSKIKHNSLR